MDIYRSIRCATLHHRGHALDCAASDRRIRLYHDRQLRRWQHAYSSNQVLRLEATGEYYRWDGLLPKNVPASSTPESTGGIGPGAWLSVGYAALKQQLASASDGMGDNLVAVKQPFTGSKATTVHQKMREIVAINDGSPQGAEPDGVTDCSSALLGLVATVNPVVRLPFIPGTANVYYFSTFDPDALQGVTFDVDRE